MLDSGVIRPSKSSWATPIILVKKGQSMAILCGFKEIERVTVKVGHSSKMQNTIISVQVVQTYKLHVI